MLKIYIMENAGLKIFCRIFLCKNNCKWYNLSTDSIFIFFSFVFKPPFFFIFIGLFFDVFGNIKKIVPPFELFIKRFQPMISINPH